MCEVVPLAQGNRSGVRRESLSWVWIGLQPVSENFCENDLQTAFEWVN
jgi:hypothetical protein